MITIEGTFRLKSPMHVASFRSGARLNDEGKVIYDKNAKGTKPVTETMTFQFADGDNNLHDTPYLPSNGFRGAMRRFAAKRVMKSIGPCSMEAYHGLMCGASSGKPDKGSVTIHEIKRAREDVYMGLFGGSPSLYRSRYRAFDLIPVTDAAITGKLIPEAFRAVAVGRRFGNDQANDRYAKPYELTGYLDFNRVDDIVTFRDQDADKFVADYEKETLKWIEAIDTNKKAVKASKESDDHDKTKKMSIDAMSAIEVLAAGIHMHAKFDFAEELPEHQVGFGMLCIMDLVNKNQLGGWGRNGFGTYEPNLNVYSDGEDLGPLLKESKRGYEIHEQNASFVDAAEDAVAALSLDGVETFFAARS